MSWNFLKWLAGVVAILSGFASGLAWDRGDWIPCVLFGVLSIVELSRSHRFAKEDATDEGKSNG